MPISPNQARRPVSTSSRFKRLIAMMVGLPLIIVVYQAWIYPSLTSQERAPQHSGVCSFVVRVPEQMPDGSRPVLQTFARQFSAKYQEMEIKQSPQQIQDRISQNHQARYGRHHLLPGDVIEDC